MIYKVKVEIPVMIHNTRGNTADYIKSPSSIYKSIHTCMHTLHTMRIIYERLLEAKKSGSVINYDSPRRYSFRRRSRLLDERILVGGKQRQPSRLNKYRFSFCLDDNDQHWTKAEEPKNLFILSCSLCDKMTDRCRQVYIVLLACLPLSLRICLSVYLSV